MAKCDHVMHIVSITTDKKTGKMVIHWSCKCGQNQRDQAG